MSDALNLSLKELLGDSGYLKYLETVIVPQLDRLVQERKLDAHQVAKVRDLVRTKC